MFDRVPTALIYPAIQEQLRQGNHMHIFRSGGGLRVVRIEKEKYGGKLLGYGEYCNVEEALDIADCKLAGEKSKYTIQYLTGSCTNSSKLDQWVRCGYDTNFRFENGKFVFMSHMNLDIRTPKKIVDRVINTGNSEEWEFEGRKYLSYRSKYKDYGCTTKCISHEQYVDAWQYPIDHIVSANTFEDLLNLLEEKLEDMDKLEKVLNANKS